MRSVEELKDLDGKRVFLRADLDVPLVESGGVWSVSDPTRLKSFSKTLDFLVRNKARVVIGGHLDRPGGVPDPSKSSRPVADYLKSIYPAVTLSQYCVGPRVEAEISALASGQILVLENLRFLADEQKGSEDLARGYAALADYYVNDSFANSHRTDTSMVAVTKFLPSFAGFHLQDEVRELSLVLKTPARPLYVVIGGAKVETKVLAVKNFVNIADKILVGGLVGCHDELKNLGPKIEISCGDPDLSFNKAKEWATQILEAKMIVWNGPMGDISKNQLVGTDLIAMSIVEATKKGACSIVGGGDTEAYLRKNSLDTDISFISVGGGAMLEFLSGQPLPALVPLTVS